MDSYNDDKLSEIKADKAINGESRKSDTQVIFGVEISFNDKNLNGIVEKETTPHNRSSELEHMIMHCEDLGLGE